MTKIFLAGYIPIPDKHILYIFGKDIIVYKRWINVKKTHFYWLKYIYKNIIFLYSSNERKESDVQVFDSIVGCFFFNPSKKNILILHSYDIGVGSEIIRKNSSSIGKNIIIFILELLLGRYIRSKILLFDSVFVTTQDRYLYIKENITKKVKFLPNIIDTIDINAHDKPYIDSINTILCPERVELNKGLKTRKKLILQILKLNPSSKFYFLEAGNDLSEFKAWLNKNNINVVWFPFLKREELQKKIYNADLVLGIFKNGALSMNNIETMLLKTSIVTYDRWGIIKKDNSQLTEYLIKIYQDKDFRVNEINLNFTYVKDIYSAENFKKIFLKSIK